jgi:glycosyltransferase involved in cell wall biosynthesis
MSQQSALDGAVMASLDPTAVWPAGTEHCTRLRRLMVFVTQVGGHNPNFVRGLLEAAQGSGEWEVVLVSSPWLLAQLQADPAFTAQARQGGVRFAPLTAEDAAYIDGARSWWQPTVSGYSLFQRHFSRRVVRLREWRICATYAARLGVHHCLFVNFDFYAFRAALGSRFPCRFSGIFHNLSFHYPSFEDVRPSLRERVRAIVQRWTLERARSNRQAGAFFCLDPHVVEHASAARSRSRIVHLPTPARLPVSVEGGPELLRSGLGIEPDRRVFLMFGGITRRKGVFELLEALRHLPDDTCRRIAVLLVGRQAEPEAVRQKVAEIGRLKPVEIICRDEFVAESEIPTYFQLADIALAVHPRHVGVSVTLAHAAHALRPVLASSYGLVGRFVRENRLGAAVDTTRPEEIARAMAAFVAGSPQAHFDVDAAGRFARSHSVERYASTLLSHLADGEAPVAPPTDRASDPERW